MNDKRARAEEAKRILDHPIFIEALDKAEEAAVNTFKAANPRDTDELIAARYALRAQQNLRQQLIQIINAGKQME